MIFVVVRGGGEDVREETRAGDDTGVTLSQGWKQAYFFLQYVAALLRVSYGKVITRLDMISQPVLRRTSGCGPGEGFPVRRRS